MTYFNNLPRQHGAALITSLIFMMIISVLAVTSMSTSSLEEKMAAGFQDYGRASLTAEIGLERAILDQAAFSTGNTVNDQGTSDPSDDVYVYEVTDSSVGVYSANTTYNSVFRTVEAMRRGSGWGSGFNIYHFDLSSVGTTTVGASVDMHAGIYYAGPK